MFFSNIPAMFSLFCAVSAIMLLEALMTLFKVRRFRDFFIRRRSESLLPSQNWPKVALLAPCKGIDFNLRENIESWFQQDYPDYHVFFIVESKSDAAYQVLQRYQQATVFVAGKAEDCGQKVHNLQYAIDRLPEAFRVFAFVDSDCFLQNDWLKRLVNCILQSPENAATGYRWFLEQNSFGSFLRAVWNSSVLTLNQENGKRNFAWGGSMAITREAFESCRVRECWSGSISDDYGLTEAMQSSGRCVEFVPGVIGWTKDSVTFVEFVRWAFRQLLITRIYYPRLWLGALFFHTLWLLWIVTGILLFPFYFLGLFLFVQLIQGYKATLRLQCIPFGNQLLFQISGPLIGLCNAILLLGTTLTRTVVWRGRKYILHSRRRMTVQ